MGRALVLATLLLRLLLPFPEAMASEFPFQEHASKAALRSDQAEEKRETADLQSWIDEALICPDEPSPGGRIAQFEPHILRAFERMSKRYSYPDLATEMDYLRLSYSNMIPRLQFFQEMERSVGSETLEKVLTYFEIVKRITLDAVDRRFLRSLPSEKRFQIMNRIQSIVIEPASKFLERDFAESASSWMMGPRLSLAELSCTQLAWNPSAFYYAEENKVVICPGLLIDLAENHQGSEESLFFLLAHELGHSIDADYEPGFYSSLQAALPKDFKSEFFLKETSADHVAAHAIKSWLSDSEREHATSILKATLARLCHLPEVDEGSALYPSGSERIRLILKFAINPGR